MSSATICIMITIFVYLVGMLLIGFHYAKKNESSSDFYLGGRAERLPLFAASDFFCFCNALFPIKTLSSGPER